MGDSWSAGEKKAARRAFDQALAKEYAALLSAIKQQASELEEPEDIWKLHDYLTQRRKEIDQKYDYRYSQLVSVFGSLLADNWLEKGELEGLDEEKIQRICSLAEFYRA